jgi:hypothetical protein
MNSTVGEEKDVRLQYYLGEFRLGSRKFSGFVIPMPWWKEERSWPAESGIPAGKDVLLLRSAPLPDGEPERIAVVRQSLRYIPSVYPRYFTDMQGSFQDYLAKFSAKTRSTLQRKVRGFTSQSGGRLDVRTYHQAECLPEFRRLGREISAKTYQEKLYDAGLPDTDDYWNETTRLAALDRVRAYALFSNGQPAAYLICPVTEDGTLIYEHLGYDPAFAKASPGTVLQFVVFEQLFAEARFRMFDFTEGEGSHKELFSTGSVRCGDIYFFQKTGRNLYSIGLHAGLADFSVAVSGFLLRMGLKTVLRKILRRLAPNR